jgi:hypothetical protein
VIFYLKVYKLILEISTPSIVIIPFSNSISLDRVNPSVVLPEPVLPTIPIFFPAGISKAKFLITRSVCGLYLKETASNLIPPNSGQALFS